MRPLRSRARKAVTLLGGTAFSLFDGTPHYGDQPGVQGAVVGGGSGLGALVQRSPSVGVRLVVFVGVVGGEMPSREKAGEQDVEHPAAGWPGEA